MRRDMATVDPFWQQPSRVLGTVLVAFVSLLLLATLALVSYDALQGPKVGSRVPQASLRRQDADGKVPGIPVFMMHGLEDCKESFIPMQRWISEARPGTLTIPVPLFENRSSFSDLHTQVDGLTSFIRSTVDADPPRFRHGYDLVCFSQGGLVCRAAVQAMDDHNVQTLVSLAGPQQGVFGHAMYWWKTITGLPSSFSIDGKTEIFYRPGMQSMCSVANMWHDPTQEVEYLSDNVFLPLYNGLTDDPSNARRKANFLRLKKAVFTAGGLPGEDGDGIVEPARSAAFDYYKNGSTTEYVPMREQKLYVDDTFGLRSLDERGRLTVTVVPGVRHGVWMLKKTLVVAHVLPHLTPRPELPAPQLAST